MVPASKLNESVRQPARLSSGILGMKFMKKDEKFASPPPLGQEIASKESRPSSSSGFKHEKDPGEWFAPSIDKFKPLSQKDTSGTISLSEIYESAQEVSGRRNYGPSSHVTENMAFKGPTTKILGKNKVRELKQRTANKGTKRSSDTEIDSSKAAIGKRRKGQ